MMHWAEVALAINYAPEIQLTICLAHACVAIVAAMTDSEQWQTLLLSVLCAPWQQPAQCVACSDLPHDAEHLPS